MKYKLIAEKIITDIQSQKLEQGQRLPSLRQLSKQLDISMTTALNSYRNLEQRGWVITQPKSGFFVSSPYSHGLVPPQPQFSSSLTHVPRMLGARAYQEIDVTPGPFGVSQLSPNSVDLLPLKRSIKRTVHTRDDLLNSYSDPQGNHELRRAITEHFSSKGFSLSANDIFISSGCIDAIRVAILTTTKPNDAVAISSPCFNGLLALLSSLSRKVVEIPCTSDGLDLAQLENQFKSKTIHAALFSSAHMNPNGISLSVEQKQKLAVLANKHKVPIIEDDVYGELNYANTFALPIKHWDSNGYVLWCSSVSKTLASGLRIGWCAPGKYLSACVDICVNEQLAYSGLLQASLADFINAGHYHKHLSWVRKTLPSNANAYRQILLNELPQGSAVSLPKGGLVLWVQVPGLDAAKLLKFTQSSNIDIRFGAQFTTRKLYRDCFRINIGWSLSEIYDSHRTIEQALLQLTAGVSASLK